MMAVILETIYAFAILCFFGGMNAQAAVVTPILPWMIFLCVEYLLELQFLKKERTESSFYLLNIIFCVINTAGLLTVAILGRTVESLAIYGIFGFGNYIMLVAASIILNVLMMKHVTGEMTDQKMLSHFEIAVLLGIVYFTLLDAKIDLPLDGTICMIGAPILCFFSLTALRSGKRGKGAAKNVIKSPSVYVSLGIFGAVLLWCMTARDSMTRVSQGTISAGKSFLLFLGHMINRFMEWLMQFFHPEELELEGEGTETVSVASVTESDEIDLSWLLPYIVAAIVIVAVIIIIKLLLHARKYTKSAVIRAAVIEHEDEVREGDSLWKRICAAVRFEKFYYKNRYTPIGIYIWLIRYGKRHKNAIAEGQTAREYMESYQGNFTADSTVRDFLCKLPSKVEACLYDRRPREYSEMEGAREFKREFTQVMNARKAQSQKL